MCLGALPWAGIHSLVCGAREEDARAVGFDEGDKPADWIAGLERRGIRVTRDVRREEARQILEDYVRRGGVVYNG
jgi:tRNA(Arg) A34 adenosine deaminase TadA